MLLERLTVILLKIKFFLELTDGGIFVFLIIRKVKKGEWKVLLIPLPVVKGQSSLTHSSRKLFAWITLSFT